MRPRLAVLLLSCCPLAVLPSCKKGPGAEPAPLRSGGPASSVKPLLERTAQPRPVDSAVVALEQAVQAQKLVPPARRMHEPQLAFGKNTLGRLTRDGFAVYDSRDFSLLAEEALESPRALLALADGSLLAIGARAMLRWERDKKRPTTLPRPMLLPGAQLYADAQQYDLIWTFDGGHGSADARPGTLRSYRLAPGPLPLLLPEQTVELSSPGGGVLGVTREGVWLYVTAGRVERFSPGGLRLPGFTGADAALPTWVVPARRLDQSLWLDERGQASRVLLAPGCKRLATVALPGAVVDVDVGDQGRLLALVLVTGPGPRFELSLLDQDLAPLGRVLLPSDAPTGSENWVKVVTENQTVVVAPGAARVAVGGPSRLSIFDGHGAQLFSIPSK
ncbi:MAG: hypothetical protein ABUL60_19320 [Myxococcales bacterium]